MKIIKRLLNKTLTLLGLSTTTQPSGSGPIYLPPPSPPSVHVVERREKPGKEAATAPEPPKEANEAEESLELDSFDDWTGEDVVQLWELFKSAGLSSGDAWNAVMAGITLNMGFGRSKNLSQSTH